MEEHIPNSYNVNFSNGYDEDVVRIILEIWSELNIILIISKKLDRRLLQAIISIFRYKPKATFHIEKWKETGIPMGKILSINSNAQINQYCDNDFKNVTILNIKSEPKHHLDYRTLVKNYDIGDILQNTENITEKIPKTNQIFIVSNIPTLVTLAISSIKKLGYNNIYDISECQQYLFQKLQSVLQGMNINESITEVDDEQEEDTSRIEQIQKSSRDDNLFEDISMENSVEISQALILSKDMKKSQQQNLIQQQNFDIQEQKDDLETLLDNISEQQSIENPEIDYQTLQKQKQLSMDNQKQKQTQELDQMNNNKFTKQNSPKNSDSLKESLKNSSKLQQQQQQIQKNDTESSEFPDSEIIPTSTFMKGLNKTRTKTIIYFNPTHNDDEQTIGTLGKGSYGKVKQIIDWKQKMFYAIKSFTGPNAQKDYMKEKDTYMNLYKTFGKQMENYGMLLNRADDVTYSLYYNLGLCSLKEFNEYRYKNKIRWAKKELLYIFKRLVEFVLFMYNKNYYHGDLKPMNIVVFQNSKNQLEMKIIDFAGASQKWSFHEMITPLYFNSYKRTKFILRHPQFENETERLKNELYTVIRVFQDICINSFNNDQLKEKFSFEKGSNNKPLLFQTQENLNFVMEGIKNEFKDYYQQNDFKQFFDFLQQKMIPELYEIEEIKKFISNKEIFPKSITHIEDTNDICRQIIQDKLSIQKKKNTTQDKDPMEQLFQLESYQPPECTKAENGQERLDLYTEVSQFMQNQDQQILVIYGDAGTGKASFLLYLKDKLGYSKNCKFIKLSKVREVNQLIELVNQIYSKIDKFEKLIFLLDGYEEIQKARVDLSVIFQLNQNPQNKIIVTTRKESLPHSQISQIFKFNRDETYLQTDRSGLNKSKLRARQKVITFYICLFSENQVKMFTQEFIKTIKKKQYYYNIKFYDSEEQYYQRFEQYPELKQMTQNPLFLRIILEVLPEIEEQITEEHKKKLETLPQLQKKYFSNYNLIKQFLELFLKRKLQHQVDRIEDIENIYKKLQKSMLLKNSFQIVTELNRKLALDLFLKDNKYFSLDLLKQLSYNSNEILNVFFYCSPFQKSEFSYQFIHRSVSEYYIATEIIQELENLIDIYKTNNNEQISIQKIQQLSLNLKLLQMKHLPIISMVVSFFRNKSFGDLEILKIHVLLHIILQSKQEKPDSNTKIHICSANAATLYNMMNFSFSGLNLNQCKLQGAILQSAIMYKTQLENANLTNVNFTDAIITHASLDNSNLTNVNFGKLPCFLGHEGFVYSVDFSSNGKYIVSTGNDSTIRIWEVDTGDEVRNFTGHYDRINTVVFSKDGRYLATGGIDKNIMIWDPSQGISIKTLVGHLDVVQTVVFSQNSQYLASGSFDKTIKIWDINTGQILHNLIGHKSRIQQVSFSWNDQYLVSAGQDKLILIWDWQQQKILQTFEGHEKEVKSIAFSPDNEYLISGSDDLSIRIWECLTGKQVTKISQAHTAIIYQVACSFDGKQIASCSEDKSIKIWDIESGKLLKQLEGHEQAVYCISFCPIGHYLASGSRDETIRFWDLDSHHLLTKHQGHDNAVLAVQFSPDSKYIASGGSDKTIRVWNTNTLEQIHHFKNLNGSINSVIFSKNGNQIITNRDNRIWNISNQSGHEFTQLESLNDSNTFMVSACFSHDDKYVAAGVNSEIKVWQSSDGSLKYHLQGHSSNVSQIVFLQNSKFILSSSYDSTVRIWKMNNGSTLKTITIKEGKPKNIVVSPNEQFFAVGTLSGFVKIFKSDTFDLFKQLEGHTLSITTIQFSPDNNLLASASIDRTIRIYEYLTSEVPMKVFEVPQNEVRQLCFTPDCQYIVIASYMSIKVWNLYNQAHDIVFKGHTEYINSIAICNSGKYVISGSNDKSIRIWDRQNNLLVNIIAQTQVFDCQQLSYKYAQGISFSNANLLQQYMKDSEMSMGRSDTRSNNLMSFSVQRNQLRQINTPNSQTRIHNNNNRAMIQSTNATYNNRN